ncbi:MAG: hypothetical protein LQ342_005399 [Letrouitia transgressa]|nr:MAG: hypothetical protein LQ342_005399 [Letrouitia transgressa]
MTPPEGPRSFLYEQPCPSDGVCFGQCIELDMDAEPPDSPRSALEREEHIAAILPPGRQPNWDYNENRELPIPPEADDNSSEAGSNDSVPSMLRRYQEQRRLRAENQLIRISWEIARDYMGRDMNIFDEEGSNIDAHDSESETWIDDTYTNDMDEGGRENRDTNTSEADAGI